MSISAKSSPRLFFHHALIPSVLIFKPSQHVNWWFGEPEFLKLKAHLILPTTPSGKRVHRSLSSSKLPSTKHAEVEKSACNPFLKCSFSVGLTHAKMLLMYSTSSTLLLPTCINNKMKCITTIKSKLCRIFSSTHIHSCQKFQLEFAFDYDFGYYFHEHYAGARLKLSIQSWEHRQGAWVCRGGIDVKLIEVLMLIEALDDFDHEWLKNNIRADAWCLSRKNSPIAWDTFHIQVVISHKEFPKKCRWSIDYQSALTICHGLVI